MSNIILDGDPKEGHKRFVIETSERMIKECEVKDKEMLKEWIELSQNDDLPDGMMQRLEQALKELEKEEKSNR